MARKAREGAAEQLLSTIWRLKPNGDAISIHVYKKGGQSGMSGSHLVHPSNEGSSEGWMREAVLVRNLTDVYDNHLIYTDLKQLTPKHRHFSSHSSSSLAGSACPAKEECIDGHQALVQADRKSGD